MTIDRVMLLIDADNVSVDVMEQAIRLLLNQHGGLHVRRAYCTAESAVANQAFFKRMGIKPMVNLAAGKNSTDIAMAVDAIDLVLAERPDVVVIASSDSDFAPLVQRLREKGCVVRGIGQKGKVGDETQDVYDDYTVLEHRKSAAPAPRPARKAPARKTAAAKKAVAEPPPPPADAVAEEPEAPPPKPARKAAAKKAPAAKKAATKTAAAKTTRKTPARKTAVATRTADEAMADVMAAVMAEETVEAPPPPPAPVPVQQQAEAPRQNGRGNGKSATVDDVLRCLPQLAAGQPLALNVAVQRLREAQLLGRNTSSLKFFAQLRDAFELVPAGKPTQVRLAR